METKLAIIHANGKGTGCAIELSLTPAEGCISGGLNLRIANQMTVATEVRPAMFDFDTDATMVLDWLQCAEVLQVFRGECESIRDGRGRTFKALGDSFHYNLTHKVEPVYGYLLELDVARGCGRRDKYRMFLSNAESLGIATAIESSMSAICFGR